VLLSTIDQHVGRRITEMRIAVGLSIEGLAERVGVSPAQLRAFEAGQQRPNAAELLRLHEVLRVPTEYFFESFSPHEDDVPAEDEAGTRFSH
jgi:transcriptional regulator with XRE-family HTH domain